ncbi:MAG: ubiquinone biosynthesis accessory factor UbiJ [Thiomicrorhabdus sp.]|nr:MAG: ubiquinone biosynthesis accessory factor UbiJ [Thiomicrorhabdus sp.]
MSTQPGLVNISISKSIESVLNTAIRLDEQKGAIFNDLEDKVIAMRLAPLETPLYFMFTNYMVSVQNQLTGEADVEIEAAMLDFMTLPINKTLPHKILKGDTALGNVFINGLCQLDIDWEEHLSHYTGDLVAFKIGHGLRSIFDRKQAAKSTTSETIREYLQFEIEALPTQSQVKRFTNSVEKVTTDVDLIAARIESLLAKNSPQP